MADKKDKNQKQEILKLFVKLTKTLKRVPTRKELRECGFSEKAVNYNFLDYNSLVREAKAANPQVFANVFTEDRFTMIEAEKVVQAVKGKKRVLVTTAVPDAKVNLDVLATLKSMSQKMDAPLLILITKGDWLKLDPVLYKEHLVFGDLKLNKHLNILGSMPIAAQSYDPTKELAAFTKPNESVVLASTKQIFSPAPNMGKLPRALFGTGALTYENYMNTAAGIKASKTHFFGAYLFEIKNREVFFPRNLQFLSDGSTISLGVQYYPSGKTRKLSPEEIVRVDGDHHAAEMDPRVEKKQDEMQKLIPAWCNVSHDTWSMVAGNHHTQHMDILLAQMASRGDNKMEKERLTTRDFLSRRAAQFQKVMIVPSNHNEALNRYGQRSAYVKDHVNWFEGHVFALAQFMGVDPVQFAINHMDDFKKNFKNYMLAVKEGKKETFVLKSNPLLDKVQFMKLGDSFTFGGFELGFHGCDGSGGSAGSPEAMKIIHAGKSSDSNGVVTGHTHSSRLFNRSIVVGTSTGLPHHKHGPGYAKGKPNAWLQADALIYQPKGYRGQGIGELVLTIEGEWKI